MNDQTDPQLLRAFAEHRSEPAFAELVRRHVDFVHSAAQRMVCDSHLAQDVTQGVFVALAKNAGQLVDRPVLSGWLHRTAQNIAAQTVRTDVRRRARESEAATMNELLSTPDASWNEIAPHLDAALGQLSEPDRDALLLRYFERKSAREMSQTLGISDEAAQKRVRRAVERLREFFAKRGVTVGAGGLVVVISANAVQAAPAGLAVTISAAALAGTAATTATVIAVTKTIAMTTLQKTLVTATVAVLAGAGIYEARQADQLRGQNQTLQQQQVPLAEQIRQLQQERDDAKSSHAASQSDADRTELVQLRGQVNAIQKLEDENTHLKVEKDDLAKRIQQFEAEQSTNKISDVIPGEIMSEVKSRLMHKWGDAVRAYAREHGGQLPPDLSAATNYLRDASAARVEARLYGFEFDGFDLLCQGSLTNIKDPSHTILIREKQPWRYQNIHPVWALKYLLVDDHGWTATSLTGDFATFEKEHSFTQGEP